MVKNTSDGLEMERMSKDADVYVGRFEPFRFQTYTCIPLRCNFY
jgi:hypothetical protein